MLIFAIELHPAQRMLYSVTLTLIFNIKLLFSCSTFSILKMRRDSDNPRQICLDSHARPYRGVALVYIDCIAILPECSHVDLQHTKCNKSQSSVENLKYYYIIIQISEHFKNRPIHCLCFCFNTCILIKLMHDMKLTRYNRPMSNVCQGHDVEHSQWRKSKPDFLSDGSSNVCSISYRLLDIRNTQKM